MKKLITICLFLLISNTIGTKLNYPRVLLPIFDKLFVNFTLEVVEKGCFKWSSSRVDLIQITPIYEESGAECTSKAIVTGISKEKRRSTAIVLAEDISSGEVLRCDIILDVIHQLGVLTTTRELYLEEAPETFELWAQDSQGNAFTTLEGIEFNWQILSQNHHSNIQKRDNSWHQVLRFLTFSESKYHEVPKTVEKFEYLGLRGYMALLEGINTGTAKVTVKLPYPEYSHVSAVEVEIMILANIILDPSDVHILVGDSVEFRVLQLKQGKLQEISLNNQYYLEIDNKELATVKETTATGHKLGKTFVVLRDRNVPNERLDDKDSFKLLSPRASLTVTKSDKISINLLPHYNWITVEGEKHEIAIDLYTHDDQKITLGNKYRLQSKFDETHFYPITRSYNGSRIYGEAVKGGSSIVDGSFENLATKAELLIYKGINLIPSLVVIPFDPTNPLKQKILFTATGGDGMFTWTSMNTNIININQNGLAETKIEDFKGTLDTVTFDENFVKISHIKASISRNTKIYKTAKILFLPPKKLEIVKYNFETSLKDYVKIYVALYAYNNGTYLPFTTCDNLIFDLEFSNDIFQVEPVKNGGNDLLANSCRLFNLKSISLGTTTLQITYKYLDIVLKDSVTLSVFEKLNIFNPQINEIVLPIGSSRYLIYFNGPQKMYNLETELYSNIKFDKNVIKIDKTVNDKDKHIFNVLCTKIGETDINFQLYNILHVNNFLPFKSVFITKVYCVKPRFITLYTTEKLQQGCPIDKKKSLLHVKKLNDNMEIDIQIFDAMNRKLDNISSLVLDWEFYEIEKLHQTYVRHVRESVNDIIEGVPIPKRDYIITSISDINTNFKIKSKVTHYNINILDAYQIKPEIPHFGIQKVSNGPLIAPVIENELNFVAINSTLLPYDSLTIFLSHNREENVKIAQGSGFYKIKLSEPDIITVVYDNNIQELIIKPLKIGDCKITIHDRCLSAEPSYLFVSVVTIGRIELQVADRVEKTKTIEAIVKLYDSNDQLIELDLNNLKIYNISEQIFNTNILTIHLGDQYNLNYGELRFIITGLELGETKIIFNSFVGDKLISTAPASIQVFPPLRLYPRNVTILVGANIQIYSKGGPSPDVNIIYIVHNDDVVSMDGSIASALKLGETKITGQCIGINPATGNQIVFSEDTIIINVVPLNKIKIKTPLVRIKSGCIMPAYIWGLPDISPMVLGSLDSLKIYWNTNQPNVVEITSIFSDIGIEYGENDLISVRIRGLSPGKALINANVITASGVKLVAMVEVTVFKTLELESPKRVVSDPILILPSTSMQLKANLDDVTYYLDSQEHGTSLSVTKDGLVKTSEINGRYLVVAKSLDQTLLIPIEVKNIHYIMATLHPLNSKLRIIQSKIPQNINLILKVSLHDNLGNELLHNYDDINLLSYDLIKLDGIDMHFGDNFTIGVNINRDISTMLSINLKDNKNIKYSEYFIKITSEQSKSIHSIKKIYSIGDIICFESPLDTSNWYSSNDKILTVDKVTGIGRVLTTQTKYGDKITIFNGDRHISNIKYDIEVRDSDKIEFFKSYDIFNGENYKGHLVVKNHLQIDKFTNLIAKNITTCSNIIVDSNNIIDFFECNLIINDHNYIDLLNNFKTYPVFDKIMGTYACQIELITSLNDVTNMIKNNQVIINLEAKLKNNVKDVIELKMISAIIVEPTIIHLENLDNDLIIINGLEKILQKLIIKSSNNKIIDIILLEKNFGQLKYKIKLIKNTLSNENDIDDEKLFIDINSPLTQQNIQIPIVYTQNYKTCSNNLMFVSVPHMILNYLSNFGVIISIIIIIAATVWVLSLFRNGSTPTDESTLKSSYLSTTRGPNYPPSPFKNSSQISQHNKSENESISPIYGDPTLISPQKRINRRYI